MPMCGGVFVSAAILREAGLFGCFITQPRKIDLRKRVRVVMSNVPLELSLNERAGLPADLRYLVEKYPREVWQEHQNLGEMARFWLQRHDMFRELSVALRTSVSDYREGKLDLESFARFFAPRLRFFLQQLHGHHQIEDMHYFPIFMEAEKRLKKGFDILENDHEVIHEALERNHATARSFLQALHENSSRRRFAADECAKENDDLIVMLTRHLADEEDLIVPVILDRGEDALGLNQG